MNRKFEVTQFYQISLAARYFVKRGVFTVFELRQIQMLRWQLRRRYPQFKYVENPASWRLSVETCAANMAGSLSVLLPDHRTVNVTAFGTVEEVCTRLWERLSAGT